MSYSTRDELAEIEALARGGPRPGSRAAPASVPQGSRRGSSLLPGPNAVMATSSNNKEKQSAGDVNDDGDDLLVDFPGSDDEAFSDSELLSRKSASKSQKPNLNLTNQSGKGQDYSTGQAPVGGLDRLKDCNDYRDRDDDPQPLNGLPGAPMPSQVGGGMSSVIMSNGGRPMQKPKPPSHPSTGSQMNRPYVGGFAAAAYEAAREFHYTSEAPKDKANVPERKGRLPSI